VFVNVKDLIPSGNDFIALGQSAVLFLNTH